MEQATFLKTEFQAFSSALLNALAWYEGHRVLRGSHTALANLSKTFCHPCLERTPSSPPFKYRILYGSLSTPCSSPYFPCVLLMRESTRSYLIDTGKCLLQKLIVLDGQKPFHFTMIYDALVASLNQPSFWEKVTKELHTDGLSSLRSRGLAPAHDISESTLCRLTGALSGQPSNFNEAYDSLMAFIQQPSNWAVLSQELRGVGVPLANFYDVLLGFIAPMLFRDAENIPGSLKSLMMNEQIARPLKKVTVLVHCWAQTREKRASMAEPNGFLYHLYEVLDCVSPELMWAAAGPEGEQKRFYYSLKEQVTSFSKALVTLAEACYPMTKLLAQHVLEDLVERFEALLTPF
ncbi:mitoguardin 1-like isoform X2 [Sminthopsis crassicaudata]|uniref:mitoguardin 1-like isoform X2 n=1 Tax=Sminthopsis crassicaudata TaxID=9301 RepID=UPI003D69BAD9